MKKTSPKLQLKTSTVRLLQTDELTAVRGGDKGGHPHAPTNNLTNCSTSRECDPTDD